MSGQWKLMNIKVEGIKLDLMFFITNYNHSLVDGFIGISPCFEQFKEYSFFSKLEEKVGTIRSLEWQRG
jgi:hypothetical protein